jgi:hypothetical protein
LKKFHAALSKQQKGNFGLSVQAFSALRQVIAENLSDTIEHLTRYVGEHEHFAFIFASKSFLHLSSLYRLIGYAFNCGETSLNAALSIPLLSVGLATLMALFRDPDLSIHVSQDDLTLLIRETGTALLDPRLASTSELDEATASQMVRAINKVRMVLFITLSLCTEDSSLTINTFCSLPSRLPRAQRDILLFCP